MVQPERLSGCDQTNVRIWLYETSRGTGLEGTKVFYQIKHTLSNSTQFDPLVFKPLSKSRAERIYKYIYIFFLNN